MQIKLNGFNKARRQYGDWTAIRMARNIGVDFIDCYVAMFGRMPRLNHIAGE